MSIDISLVIGANSNERLSYENHIQLIKALVELNVFEPPFAVLVGNDVEREFGYRYGDQLKTQENKLLYLGDDLQSSLDVFQDGFSEQEIMWEAAVLKLEPLEFSSKVWEQRWLSGLPNPRIVSRQIPNMENVYLPTDDLFIDSFEDIGPFYDVLTTSSSRIFLGDPDQEGGPEGNYAVLSDSKFGDIFNTFWGEITGGDRIGV